MEDDRRPSCNLELSLVSPASSDQQHRQQQPMTIFYEGRCCCIRDVTEFQARAIIMLASVQEQRTTSTEKLEAVEDDQSVTSDPPPSAIVESYPPAVRQSMKRSLQRFFLQKRKGRGGQAAADRSSPYPRPPTTRRNLQKELASVANGF